MDNQLVIIILCLIGLVITIYITITHARKKKVVCPIDSKSCNIVLDSKWSKMLGIKNEVIGLLFYIAILLGLWLTNHGYSLGNALFAASVLSAVYSVFLGLIQAKIIKKFCFYCLCIAIINIWLFLALYP